MPRRCAISCRGCGRSRWVSRPPSAAVTGLASRHLATGKVPPPDTLADERLPDLLEDLDARQVLHVTFGSALAEFRPRLFELLRAHEEAYIETIARHFVRHLEPFARAG